MRTSSCGSAGGAVTADTGAMAVGESVSACAGCGVSVICDEAPAPSAAAAAAVSAGVAAVSGVLLTLSVIHNKTKNNHTKEKRKKNKKERRIPYHLSQSAIESACV